MLERFRQDHVADNIQKPYVEANFNRGCCVLQCLKVSGNAQTAETAETNDCSLVRAQRPKVEYSRVTAMRSAVSGMNSTRSGMRFRCGAGHVINLTQAHTGLGLDASRVV
jgi:hypothetical protein